MTVQPHLNSEKHPGSGKVLILTGGLLTEKETSLFHALRKQYMQKKYSRDAWLDIKLKILTIEPIIALTLEKIYNFFLRALPDDLNKRLFRSQDNNNTPELTEAVLATLLTQYDIQFELLSISQLFSDEAQSEMLLDECNCIFFSTTFIRDLSELEPLVRKIDRPHNHIVLGGALTSLIHEQWQGIEGVEILAMGYGELLMPALVDWIKSGYRKLSAPATGSICIKNSTHLLFSGLPKTNSLDFLPRTDWKLVAENHKEHYKMIYYESVRGCPYRCSFCNYPYLFEDNKFRYFSAERMASDWEYYVNELGVEYITCLDSLFTLPRRRLIDFCNLLIERNIQVKWICYARADDLADEETVKLMIQAGAHQVQIGLESGDPDILENMDKQCSVHANAKAIQNCRKYGLTTVVSLIVGFPGETEQTLQNTYYFLQDNPPDFYYLATFSTRATKVPILSEINRQRFKLASTDSPYTMAPYWQHNTMNCLEATDHVRSLNQKLMSNGISLNAVLFYAGLLHYKNQDRNILLNHQKRIVKWHPVLRSIFTLFNKWINRRMDADIHHHFKPDRYSISQQTIRIKDPGG